MLLYLNLCLLLGLLFFLIEFLEMLGEQADEEEFFHDVLVEGGEVFLGRELAPPVDGGKEQVEFQEHLND